MYQIFVPLNIYDNKNRIIATNLYNINRRIIEMNIISKKLLSLNKALNLAGIKNVILKESSLQRSVDIVSYSRKVLNLFFPYLANQIVELSDEHKSFFENATKDFNKKSNDKKKELEDMLNSVGLKTVDEFLDIIDFDLETNISKNDMDKISRLYNDCLKLNKEKQFQILSYGKNWKNKIIKIYLEKNKKKNKIYVFCKGIRKESTKSLINEFDLNIFSEEERRIFLETGHAFNIHLRSLAGGDERIEPGALATGSGGGITLYNCMIYYDLFNPNVLKNNINGLYQKILEYIAHESTHVQQFTLESNMLDVSSEVGSISYEDEFSPLVTDRGFINTKNKKVLHDWLRKNISFEEDEETYDYDETGIDIAENIEEEKALDVVEMLLYGCPEILAAAKKELEENPGIEKYDIINKYREDCSNFRNISATEKLSEEHHKDISESTDDETKAYYSKPIEVEAFIRGFRASSMGRGISLASKFSKEVSPAFKNKRDASDVWNLYKAAYKRLNYPEKDLGTDTEALSFWNSISKDTKKERELLNKIFGKK